MGDEADALQDQSDEGEPGHIKCRKCGRRGLKWRESYNGCDPGWTLVEADETPHVCGERDDRRPYCKRPIIGQMVMVHCQQCGDKFAARVADVKRGWGRYCSKSCKATMQERCG